MPKLQVKNKCANCHYPVTHSFCGACGQKNVSVRQPVWRYLGEFLAAHLSLDARGMRTIIPFLLRPGFLTREFNEGHRVRYSSPLRLYLAMSLLLFLGLALARLATDLALLEQMQPGAHLEMAEDLPAVPGVELLLADDQRRTLDEFAHNLSYSPAGYQRNISTTIVRLLGEDHAISQFITGKMDKMRGMDWAEARLAGFDNWLNLLPTAMFFLLPFCALLLRLCFLGTGRFYSEHLIFTLHLHAFIYLLMLVLSLVWCPHAIAIGAAVITGYILLGVRTAYRGTVLGTWCRGGLFLLLYLTLILAGLGFTFWLSLLMI